MELALFDKLEEASELIGEELDRDPIDEDETVEVSGAVDLLVTFVRNFLIQFFKEGYGFVIDGFNPQTMRGLVRFFKKNSSVRTTQRQLSGAYLQKPAEMIEMAKDYVALDSDVIKGPYTEDVNPLREMYCEFIPELFRAFETEGRLTIGNYREVLKRISENTPSIDEKCSE